MRSVMALVLVIAFAVTSVVSASEASKETHFNPGLTTAVIERTLTYQGLLKNNSGDPVPDATYNVTFRIYDVAVGGAALWNSGALPVTTSDGYFAKKLGPIPLPFDEPYYLSLQVSPDAEMTQRQQLTMSAYAAVSDSANYAFLALTVPDNAITTAKIANGTLLFGDIAQNGASSGQVMKWSGSAWVARNDSIGGGGSNWTLTGNLLSTNNYWGITKGGAGNIHYGDSTRSMVNLGVACTTGTSGYHYVHTVIGGGRANKAGANFATVGGGWGNRATAFYSTIGGGDLNLASGIFSVVGGGVNDSANGAAGGVFSGYGNVAGDAPTDTGAFVGGGSFNRVESRNGSIAGGYENVVIGESGTIAGGYSNLAGNSAGDSAAFVGGGRDNLALGVNSVVVGGRNNGAAGGYAVIAGGHANNSYSDGSTIGGGNSNVIFGLRGTIGGGYANQAGDAATDTGAFVGGGWDNVASDRYSTVGGGRGNNADGESSVIGGGYENSTIGMWNTIGGGEWNTTSLSYATISGGVGNEATSNYAAIGGGSYNDATGGSSTIGGGERNDALESFSTVAGGQLNAAGDLGSFVGGGRDNNAGGENSAVAGGRYNSAGGSNSAISGGYQNVASAYYTAIPGGQDDTIGTSGGWSLVFGRQVYNNDNYRVVLFDTLYNGSLNINRDGRDGTVNSYPIQVGTNSSNGNGAYLTSGGTWTNGSSRTFKENFTPFDGAELLSKISNLSVTTYNYINSTEKHVGPVAEEFVRAFDTGVIRENDGLRDDQYLAASDVAGVALAGVQELIRQIEELKNEISELKAKSK
jgi:hypothetical protein